MSQMNPLSMIGALDPISIGIDLGAQLLGLPPEVKNAAKIVVGVMTGDLICAANGAIGLAGNMAEVAQTEWKPSQYGASGQGYAPPGNDSHRASPPSAAGGSSSQSVDNQPTTGGTPNCGPTPAAGGKGAVLTAADREWYAAWGVLETNFDKAETAGFGLRDNFLTWNDIRQLANRSDVSSDVRNAAAFMLEHPERFKEEMLARGSRHPFTGDMGFNRDDLLLMVREGQRRGAFEPVTGNGGPGGGCVGPTGSGAGGPSAGGGSPVTGGSGGVGGTGGACTPGGVSSGGGVGAQDPIDAIMNDPTLSTTEKAEAILMEIMNSLDGEMMGLLKKMQKVRKEQAGAGDDQEKSADLASSMEQMQHQLQKVMERRTQMFSLLTNISKLSHEASMQAVNNMRS